MAFGRLADAVGDAAEDLVKVRPEPSVHHVVDDGVDAGVGHCEPVEREVHVANVGLSDIQTYFLELDHRQSYFNHCTLLWRDSGTRG